MEEQRPPSCITCTSLSFFSSPSCSSLPHLAKRVFLVAPPPLRLSSSDNGLSLMQIYSRFISGCLPSADCRNIAQHHASKMSSLVQRASLDSQSQSLTHLSWEEINAVVGPGWLQLYFLCVSIRGYQVSSNTWARSPVVPASPVWPIWVCPLCGDGPLRWGPFQCVGEMHSPVLSYITLLEKKKQGK